jgi:hypothetical protein
MSLWSHLVELGTVTSLLSVIAVFLSLHGRKAGVLFDFFGGAPDVLDPFFKELHLERRSLGDVDARPDF